MSGVIVTAVFYKILAVFSTPNIVFSTISVTTSFFAASLTMLRSSYYAVGYAANDVVLIVLWILASIKEPRYLPVTVSYSLICMALLAGRNGKSDVYFENILCYNGTDRRIEVLRL